MVSSQRLVFQGPIPFPAGIFDVDEGVEKSLFEVIHNISEEEKQKLLFSELDFWDCLEVLERKKPTSQTEQEQLNRLLCLYQLYQIWYLTNQDNSQLFFKNINDIMLNLQNEFGKIGEAIIGQTHNNSPQRVLLLCSHNSARSQMAEGWVRHYANELGVELEVYSAGTERTFVKPDAITAMKEVGIDITGHHSKTIQDIPDPWNFDVVVTVCDSASEACPTYPARTKRLHVSFHDPSGEPLECWREVRDSLGEMSYALVDNIHKGQKLTEAALKSKKP